MTTEQEERIMAAITAATERIMAALQGPRTATHAPASTSGGATLPNYGRRKGEPIHGCPVADLEYYASGCRRSLDDAGKARWHDKERALLAAIEAEIARQSGGGSAPAPGTDSLDDLPF